LIGKKVVLATFDQAIARCNQRVAALMGLGFELERIFTLKPDFVGFAMAPSVLLHWHLSLAPSYPGGRSAAIAKVVETCAGAARLGRFKHDMSRGVLFKSPDTELRVSDQIEPNRLSSADFTGAGSLTDNDMELFALLVLLQRSGAASLELADLDGDSLGSPLQYSAAQGVVRT